MARPIKQGLSYFPFDVSFFSDRKVRKIIRGCGPASPTILICLLCNIYEDQGYYILWDEELPFDIADTIGVPEGAVKELIKKAVDVDFFDKEMFEKEHILTSRGIQSRFIESTKKRKDVTIKKEYWIFSGNNSVNDVNNPVNDTHNEQSKEKESKEEKRKEISPSIPQGGNGGAFFNLNKIETPPSNGAKRNYEALVRILTGFNIPADDFNRICELSNNGEIGHPVWTAMQHVKDSNGKIRMPGKYIISIIEQKK
ncbi:DUF4373 domain-containing protein [Parabacteroides goldsteinii]|uniref:DUF4373 domain-containing protein n=1 Tax=Parabacteroides goldsteinii TaxID=328812 RepID=UPI002490111E|nr:DUF4373 domain-containing protein [Parabacteroides goldsteinii]